MQLAVIIARIAAARRNGTAIDPFWTNVSTLLPFLDAPTSTRMLDVIPVQWTLSASVTISTAQYKFGASSLYFGGNYTYAEKSATALGTDDFTIEGWARWQGVTSNLSFFADYRPDSTNGIYPVVYIGTDGKPHFFVNGADQISSATALAVGVWTHIAVSRVAGVTRLFLNGVQVGTNYTDTNNYLGTRLRIGGSGYNPTAGVQFGYIDEFRVTSGVGRYTANFTPPTAAFPDDYSGDRYFGQVVSLLHMEGANGSTTLKEIVLRNWSATGNAKIASGAGRFFDTGLSLDGAGSYISTGANPALTLGTGDFTIEFWFYQLAAKNTAILDTRPPSGNGAYINIGTSTSLQVGTYVQTGSIAVTSAANAYQLNTWTHVAMVRKAGVQYLYVNGVPAGSVADTTNYVASTWVIGRNAWVTTQDWNGYISDFRVTKGVARYSAAFTPPSTYFPDSLASDKYFGQVTSLLHMDGANGSTAALDKTGKVWSANGTAKLSKNVSKFGPSSLKLDGIGAYLSCTSSDFSFSTADFTVEAFIQPVAFTTGKYGIFSTQLQQTTAPYGFAFHIGDNGILSVLYGGNTDGYTAPAPANVFDGQFHHIVLQRSGGVIQMFWDGSLLVLTQIGSGIPSTVSFTTTAAVIGRDFSNASLEYFNGSIDELRITQGIARYLANFTPPTAPFADRAP